MKPTEAQVEALREEMDGATLLDKLHDPVFGASVEGVTLNLARQLGFKALLIVGASSDGVVVGAFFGRDHDDTVPHELKKRLDELASGCPVLASREKRIDMQAKKGE